MFRDRKRHKYPAQSFVIGNVFVRDAMRRLPEQGRHSMVDRTEEAWARREVARMVRGSSIAAVSRTLSVPPNVVARLARGDGVRAGTVLLAVAQLRRHGLRPKTETANEGTSSKVA
jgi:hypothetical protein